MSDGNSSIFDVEEISGQVKDYSHIIVLEYNQQHKLVSKEDWCCHHHLYHVDYHQEKHESAPYSYEGLVRVSILSLLLTIATIGDFDFTLKDDPHPTNT